MAIKAIIFDLGGVLLRTADFVPREKLAARLGISRHELEQFIFDGNSGNRAQRGEISAKSHWENLQQQLNYSSSGMKSLLDEFFANDRLDENLMNFIRELHQSYKTGLVSNGFDDSRRIITERLHIDDAFDEMIISAEVGIVKPDPRIYQLALDRLGVEARQTVFVDDFQHNVEGARAMGLNAIHFKNPEQLQLDLRQLLKRSQG